MSSSVVTLFAPLSIDDALCPFTAGHSLPKGTRLFATKAAAVKAWKDEFDAQPEQGNGDSSSADSRTAHIVAESAILTLVLLAPDFERLRAEGQVVAGKDGDWECAKDSADLIGMSKRTVLEASPRVAEGQTAFLYMAMAAEDICPEVYTDGRPPRQGQCGAWSRALSMVSRNASDFQGLRVFSSRDLALRALGKVADDDEIAVVMAAVPAAKFAMAAKMAQQWRQGYQPPEAVMKALAEVAVLTMEIVRHDQLPR